MTAATHSTRRHAPALLAGGVSLLFAAACAPLELPPEAPGTPAPPGPPGEARVTVATATASPGAQIDVRGSGLPANQTVDVGFGMPASDYSVLRRVQTDAQGELATQIEVPDWAMRGHAYVVVLAPHGEAPRAVSDAFVVGQGGDDVTVEGTLTDEGVECPALRGPGNALYTLAVGDLQYDPGTRVRVEGTIAEVSTCMQGTTIQVRSIERR
jgi:hypothetical protein